MHPTSPLAQGAHSTACERASVKVGWWGCGRVTAAPDLPSLLSSAGRSTELLWSLSKLHSWVAPSGQLLGDHNIPTHMTACTPGLIKVDKQQTTARLQENPKCKMYRSPPFPTPSS